MRRILVLVAMLAAAAASAACGNLLNNLFSSKTSATPMASDALAGSWATTQSLPGASGSLNDACVNFHWAVTEFSGTSGSGNFSATCMGNMQVTGQAMANLTTSTTATWSATATGTIAGQPPCQASLSGTATLLQTNQIKIPYSGTTCMGPVSGTEIINR